MRQDQQTTVEITPEGCDYLVREWRALAKTAAQTAMGWVEDAARAADPSNSSWGDEATVLRRLRVAGDCMSKAQEFLSQADRLERQLGYRIHPEGV